MKGQDIVILSKFFVNYKKKYTIPVLSKELFISFSEIHACIKRCTEAGFLNYDRKPIVSAIKEFLLHGIKYVFPVTPGQYATGLATSHSSPFLSQYFEDNFEDRYVWPYHKGNSKGFIIKPLYKTVPDAAKKDKELYRILSLIDCLRIGKAREKKIAEELLIKNLDSIKVYE